MPALHRMPIFYLCILFLAGLSMLGAWIGNSDPITAGVGIGVANERAAGKESRRLKSPPPKQTRRDADDRILRTPEGLRRKVLVKDLGVLCQSGPGQREVSGAPLDYFAIRYLYAAEPSDLPTHFQISDERSAPPCWVPTESVLEWNTRLMARPTPRSGRPPLVLFREEACLLDALAGRACPRHSGACPTEGEERAEGAKRSALGLPILQSRSIPQADGSVRTVFQVASLVHDQAPPLPPPAAPPPQYLPALKRVEVAFVIDTTASMQEVILAARRLAEQLVAEAKAQYRDINLKLALVDYRDHSPSFGHASRIVTRFTNPSNFLSALQTLEAARRGDGSIDEAVLDGVEQALPGSPLTAELQRLDWAKGQSGELATKLLVLLGDAPDHAEDLDRARALAERARKHGITIATIRLDRPGSLSRTEAQRYQAQWRTLAEASFRPLDQQTGFRKPVEPLALELADANQLTSRLQSLLDDRIKHARDLAALAAAQAEGRLTDYVNAQGLTLEQVAPVLVDLHVNGASEPVRPDPRYQGRKAPSVRTGWIAEQREGKPLVTVEVLVSRPELETLISELTQFQIAAQGTSRDLLELTQIGTAAAAGEETFLSMDRGNETFAEHLRKRQGLPPARPDGLLSRTQADLVQADDATRAALMERLATNLVHLIRLRNEIKWDDPTDSVDGMALIPYMLIDF